MVAKIGFPNGRSVAALIFFHGGIHFRRILFFIHERLTGIDVYLCDCMVFLFGRIEREVRKSPHHYCNLPAHIVYVILRLDIVACPLQYPGKGIADYRVPYVTDMQWTIRVCRGVLEDYFSCVIQVSEILPFE